MDVSFTWSMYLATFDLPLSPITRRHVSCAYSRTPSAM
jgi:hypothetical protein